MPVPLSVHWIPAHRGSIGGKSDRDWFALWDPSFVKLLTDDETVPYLEDVPPAARIIVRNYPLSELGHDRGFRVAGSRDGRLVPPAVPWRPGQQGSGRDRLVAGPGAFAGTRFEGVPPLGIPTRGAADEPEYVASKHAATCDRIAQWCEARGVSRTRLIFEGLNEPMLWSTEPPSAVARYYRQFVLSLHTFDLRGVAGNFGHGWPGNGGVRDAPPSWSFFEPVAAVMCLDPQRPDYLGLHGYWALNGPGEDWRWWAGRHEQCPFDVPILITETGIDTGVTGNFYGGWANLPGQMTERAKRYVDELAWYWQRCRADGRIKAIFPFTYDRGTDTWVHFDIRNEDWLREFTSRKAEFPAPAPWQPKSKPVDPPVVVKPADRLGDSLRDAFGAKLIDLRGQLPTRGSYPTRSTANIRRIIVHHTAAPAATSWQSIASYHVTTKGWPGIGYHAGITPEGELVLLNGINVISNHASGHNGDSIGVVFAGNFQTDQPTPAAMQAFYLYDEIIDDYLGRELAWQGHRDVGDTACPGDHLYTALFATPQPDLIAVLREQARARDLYCVNPGASLRRAILADGRVPTSPEYTVTHAGIDYVCQVARAPAGPAWVYWCERDKWDQVSKEQSHA